MRHLTAVVLVLISAPFASEGLAGQQTGTVTGVQEASDLGFQLGSNYPNPFNPDTRIPFDLFANAFVDGRPVSVSIRIYDILRQYVASPTALGHPAGDGTPVVDLEYIAPGHYEAYWDGRNRLGSSVPSGVYILELTVNGRSQNRRIFVGAD
jgi:hypothetical protein